MNKYINFIKNLVGSGKNNVTPENVNVSSNDIFMILDMQNDYMDISYDYETEDGIIKVQSSKPIEGTSSLIHCISYLLYQFIYQSQALIIATIDYRIPDGKPGTELTKIGHPGVNVTDPIKNILLDSGTLGDRAFISVKKMSKENTDFYAINDNISENEWPLDKYKDYESIEQAEANCDQGGQNCYIPKLNILLHDIKKTVKDSKVFICGVHYKEKDNVVKIANHMAKLYNYVYIIIDMICSDSKDDIGKIKFNENVKFIYSDHLVFLLPWTGAVPEYQEPQQPQQSQFGRYR